MRRAILGLVAGLVAMTLWPAVGQAGVQGPEWGRLIGGAGFDTGGGVARADDGSLYVAATIDGRRFAGVAKPGKKDIALVKLSPLGAVQWVKFLGGAGDDVATDVGVYDGAVYVTGYGDSKSIGGQPTAGGNDAVLARYSLDGKLGWLRLVGTARDDRANGVAAGPSGAVVAGQIGSARPANDVDLFAASFDTAGKEDWRAVLGGGGHDSGEGAAVWARGRLGRSLRHGLVGRSAIPGSEGSR